MGWSEQAHFFMASKGLIRISWDSEPHTIPFAFPRPAISGCRKAGLIPTLWDETEGKHLASSRNLWDCSPILFGKPPRGSPQLLWQMLLSPLTMWQHIFYKWLPLFCVWRRCSPVSTPCGDCQSVGFPPGRARFLLLEAAVQGFLVVERPASYCRPQTFPSHIPSAANGLPTSCNCLGRASEFVCLLWDVLPQGAPLGGLEPLAAT